MPVHQDNPATTALKMALAKPKRMAWPKKKTVKKARTKGKYSKMTLKRSHLGHSKTNEADIQNHMTRENQIFSLIMCPGDRPQTTLRRPNLPSLYARQAVERSLEP